jgi:hypothetical protein
MKAPPWLARVGYRCWTIWLPLFILWPLFILAFALMFLCGWATALIFKGETFANMAAFIVGIYRVLCELRGTQVSVEAPHRIVVAFY